MRALIAEDEPLLAQTLRAELGRVWPELTVVAVVGDGLSAVQQTLALRPEVVFLDIRMPGLTGLEAAADIADQWPSGPDAPPYPKVVFVTAYDEYALQAFEVHAVDYLLKPVQTERLRQCKQKLSLAPVGYSSLAIKNEAEAQLSESDLVSRALDQHLAQLRDLMHTLAHTPRAVVEPRGPSASNTSPPLRTLQVSVGTQIRMVPVAQVLYFEAADKYVRVVTAAHEYLIRQPLKDLMPQLPHEEFWQIHRSTIVRADAIARVTRDESGKQWVELHGRPDRLAVSRLYSDRFRAL